MFACLAKVVGCSNAGLILCLALTASAAFSGSSAGQSTIGSEANETNIIIQVQSSDGAPIPKAVVVFVGESSQAVLKGAAIEGGRERFQTDGEGRCSLPISATNVPVVTATEEGFCLMQTRDLPTHPILTVQPWACIEGVRLNRGKPLAYVGVSYDLSSQYQISMDADSLMHKGFEIPNSEAMTDLGGRFVFDHVPPAVVLIKESHFQTTGPMDRVDVKPGETNRITIATDGRSLAGRVEPAAGSTNRFNWAQGNGWLESDSSSAQALALPDIPAEFDTFESRGKWWRNWAGSTAARQRRDLITRQHTVEFHSDGSFAVDLVKPGT